MRTDEEKCLDEWHEQFVKRNDLCSILSVKAKCGNGCGIFSVGDCTSDIDGEGNLGCPVCGIIIFFVQEYKE